MLKLLKKMHPNTVRREKSLTKDTSRGLPTCRGLVNLAKHFISKNQLSYVMLGLFILGFSYVMFGILWKNNLVNFGKDVVILISLQYSKI